MANGYWSPLGIATADGPTLTAAAAATCIPVTSKFTFPPNSIVVGTMLHVFAAGRISCVVTTPGTARFDLRLNNLVFFDTGAINLNTTAKTTVPFVLDIRVTCRAVGPVGTASFMGVARLFSEAIIGSPASTAGGSGVIQSSVSGGPGSAPVVNILTDTTVSNPLDCFFTQTVATGSMTVHQFIAESVSPLAS
jgi:hypothetical protein